MKKTRKKKARKNRKRALNSARRNLNTLLPLLPFAAPPIITAFIYMWLYTHMNIVSIPTEELRNQKQELIKQNDSIRLRIEELQAPAHIESIAREKLGMIPPQEYGLVTLDEPMRPPGGFPAGPRRAAGSLRASKGSEGLFGFLNLGSSGSLSKRGEFAGASQETAPMDTARQPG